MAMTMKKILDEIIYCDDMIQKKTQEILKLDLQIAKNSNNANLSIQRDQVQKDINEAQGIIKGLNRQIKIANLNELSSREQEYKARSMNSVKTHMDLNEKIQKLDAQLSVLQEERDKLSKAPIMEKNSNQWMYSKDHLRSLDLAMSAYAKKEQQILQQKGQISQEKQQMSVEGYELSQETNKIQQAKQQILQELGKQPTHEEQQKILQELEGRLSDLKKEEEWDVVSEEESWDIIEPGAMNLAASSSTPPSSGEKTQIAAGYDAKNKDKSCEWPDDEPTSPTPKH